MSDYEAFYQLHHQETPFFLANAWNIKSARLVEQNGYPAIGTSSGAIADSMGYEDGENIPFTEILHIIQRIKANTTLPVSVDMERGYTNDLKELTENIQKLVDAGVAGINLEDAQGEGVYLKKLETIKNHLEKNGQKLFINARTDGFLLKADSPIETTIRRARLYQDAGADGLFVTAVSDPATIQAIASATSLPLNVVGNPSLSTVQSLAQCGVKRISMAVNLYKASYRHLNKLLEEVKLQQSLIPLFN